IIRDEFSRFTWVYPLKAESDAYGALELFLAENNADKANHVVLTVRSGGGEEFMGYHFSDLCKHLRIRHEYTTADHPQLNGGGGRKSQLAVAAGTITARKAK
ncbi:unnamed protein product, partial [Discosporangium mesarthrocarpum]